LSLDAFIERFNGYTEPYFFYNKTIELRYEPKEHIYYLLLDGEFIPQDGVTTVVHIIDKSDALIPWGCKMMAVKLYATAPYMILPTGEKVVPQMTWDDFEKLVVQAKGAHKEKLEEAAEVGHVAHGWIEQYIKAVLASNEPRKLELLAKFPEDERASNCCTATLRWMSAHNVRWISTERKIYSRTFQYAGTMDGLALVDSCDDPLCCKHEFKDRLSVIDWKTSNYLYLEYLYQTAAYEFAYEEEHGVDIKDRWVIRLGKDDGEFDPWHVEAEDFNEDFGGFLVALALHRSVRSVKARIKTKADFVKGELKARAKAEREAAHRIRCPKADDYKGKRQSKCFPDGTQCEACHTIYTQAQQEKNVS
jgi:hypothetical protein